MRSVNKKVNNVNIASLQEQLDFTLREYERSKIVYNSLLQEFGKKNIELLDKEISERLDFYRAINCSLKELKALRSNQDGDKQ